jgi:hypothetical protein
MSIIKCFDCNEMGHYARDCTKNTSNNQAVSSLFVGSICVEVGPEKEWKQTGLDKAMDEKSPDAKNHGWKNGD